MNSIQWCLQCHDIVSDIADNFDHHDRPRPGRVVRRRAINAFACFSSGADMLLPPAPNPCRTSTARLRRHSKTSYSACPVASGLLQVATPCWPVFQLPYWHHSSKSCTQRHAPFWISSRVTVWLQLFKSCTGYQLPRGSSTSCACWFTSRFWDTCRNTHRTSWRRLPKFRVDLLYAPRRMETSSCRGHVDESATELFLLPHRWHGTSCRRSWNCCDQRTRSVVMWKHFCLILFTGTRIRIDSVMRARSSSRRCNISALVTVTQYTEATVMYPSQTYIQW